MAHTQGIQGIFGACFLRLIYRGPRKDKHFFPGVYRWYFPWIARLPTCSSWLQHALFSGPKDCQCFAPSRGCCLHVLWILGGLIPTCASAATNSWYSTSICFLFKAPLLWLVKNYSYPDAICPPLWEVQLQCLLVNVQCLLLKFHKHLLARLVPCYRHVPHFLMLSQVMFPCQKPHFSRLVPSDVSTWLLPASMDGSTAESRRVTASQALLKPATGLDERALGAPLILVTEAAKSGTSIGNLGRFNYKIWKTWTWWEIGGNLAALKASLDCF